MTGRPQTSAGRYQTLRRLAVGGMGEIFLARETGKLGFTRLVVIKRMLPELARKQHYVDMFVDEARIVGQLGHPNICQVIELGEEDGVPYIALEYVRGDSLSGIWDRAITTGSAVPRAVTLRILADTAWALHHAHEACDADGRPLNVIHRDISPHNVMVSFHGDVKLMDFGIARAENRLHRTDTGKVKGKIAYMAPEQLRGNPLDRRADVFAIGVMLWELTLSRRLFGGGGEVETLQKAVECKVPPPRSIDPTYPARLETIVMSALSADASRRTATAGEIAELLLDEVAALGGAERSDVAALMRRLFPDEIDSPEDMVPTRTWIDSGDVELFEPTTPVHSQSDESPRPTVPMRSQSNESPRPTVSMRGEPGETTARPTVPLRSEPAVTRSAPAVAELAPTLADAPDPRSRRWLWLGLATICVAGGIGAIAATIGGDSSTPAPTLPTPAPTSTRPAPATSSTPAPRPSLSAAPQVAAAPPAPVPPVAPSPSPTKTPPGRVHVAAASVAKAEPGNGNGARTQPETKPATLPVADPVRLTVPGVVDVGPAPATADARGTLAVSSEQTGVVVIDGVRHKSTPFQTIVPAGEHEVVLELSEGAGTLRARANVVPGRKTKCKADRSALACSSP